DYAPGHRRFGANGRLRRRSLAGGDEARERRRIFAAKLGLVHCFALAGGADRRGGTRLAHLANLEDPEYAERHGNTVRRRRPGLHWRADVAAPLGRGTLSGLAVTTFPIGNGRLRLRFSDECHLSLS